MKQQEICCSLFYISTWKKLLPESLLFSCYYYILIVCATAIWFRCNISLQTSRNLYYFFPKSILKSLSSFSSNYHRAFLFLIKSLELWGIIFMTISFFNFSSLSLLCFGTFYFHAPKKKNKRRWREVKWLCLNNCFYKILLMFMGISKRNFLHNEVPQWKISSCAELAGCWEKNETVTWQLIKEFCLTEQY